MDLIEKIATVWFALFELEKYENNHQSSDLFYTV